MQQYKERFFGYEGFETWRSATFKTVYMHGRIFSFLLIVALILFCISFYFSFDYKTDVTVRYTIAKFMCESGYPGTQLKLPIGGQFIRYSAIDIYNNDFNLIYKFGDSD